MIPSAVEQGKCGGHHKSSKRRLRTLPCVDYCGMVMVYFHVVQNEEPEFELPRFLEEEVGNTF
jgi:hypothetical protein